MSEGPDERWGGPWTGTDVWEASGVAGQDWPAGALYVVATPIGNAADLTLRALWVLSRVDAIAAEDTRMTRPLLQRYGIATPLLAAHQHNEHAAAARIIERLQRGERVALVSDAGTPGVSDPGARIVADVRAAGLRVVPLPGASSALAALAAAGCSATGFRFIGFLPQPARARGRLLHQVCASEVACVLFEAPHRIVATAQALAAALPAERPVTIARELTKKFESIEKVPAAALPAWAATHQARGEYVLVIDAAAPAASVETEAQQIDPTTQRWLDALAEALPAARAAAVAAQATGLGRDVLYAALVAGRANPPGADRG